MPKRTLVLIIGLILIAVGLLLLATSASPLTTTQKQPSQPTPTPVAFTTLAFSPDPVTVSNATANSTVNVIINTNENSVSAVQLELSFNPKELTVVDIAAPQTTAGQATAFFDNPTIFTKKIDQRNGRITYAMAPKGDARSGSGTVATIIFRLAPGVQRTTIGFSKQTPTLVTAPGVSTSVVRSTTDATISVQ